MNISAINLNLLKVLHAILQERHVTAAGKRACLSQSATSNVLKQLRDVLGDAILVRGQSGQMQLTPYALSIRDEVRELIEGVESLFSGTKLFDPSSCERTFHIGMSDYLSSQLLPSLLTRLHDDAPHVKLVVHHVNRLDDPGRLRRRELDLVLGNFNNLGSGVLSDDLFEDYAGFIACASHPLARKKRLTLEQIIQYPLTMVGYMENPSDNYLDQLLRSQGYDERVSMVVPHAWVALSTLKDTTFISHTTHGMAKSFVDRGELVFLPTPESMKDSHASPYTAKQYWHKSLDHDPAISWLRSLILRVSQIRP